MAQERCARDAESLQGPITRAMCKRRKRTEDKAHGSTLASCLCSASSLLTAASAFSSRAASAAVRSRLPAIKRYGSKSDLSPGREEPRDPLQAMLLAPEGRRHPLLRSRVAAPAHEAALSSELEGKRARQLPWLHHHNCGRVGSGVGDLHRRTEAAGCGGEPLAAAARAAQRGVALHSVALGCNPHGCACHCKSAQGPSRFTGSSRRFTELHGDCVPVQNMAVSNAFSGPPHHATHHAAVWSCGRAPLLAAWGLGRAACLPGPCC
jgi:hypothetical protein